LKVFENRVLRRVFGPEREKWREAEEDCISGASQLVCFTKYYYSDQIKKDKIGRKCSMHERAKICIQYFGPKMGREDTI